jgi:hypothetical protein
MSSFTQAEIDTLYDTDNVEMLKDALARLNEEIPRLQKIRDIAVEDGEKTGNFCLANGILYGAKAGLKDYGLSPDIGLKGLRDLKRAIKDYLKPLPEVQPEVKEIRYGNPPKPSPEEASAEQDAIEESMDCEAEKKDCLLQEMILDDRRITEFEESPDEDIHRLVAEEQEKILKERLVDEFTENFRNMLMHFFKIN